MYDSLVTSIEVELYYKRKELQNIDDEENLKKSISVTKDFLKKMFAGNNPELINLLSYDAHSLFFKANKDMIEMDPAAGDYVPVELSIPLEEDKTLPIKGGITIRHEDLNTNQRSYYYGDLCVEYDNDNIGTLIRYFKFDENSLKVTTTINDREYVEVIGISNEGELIYSVSCDAIVKGQPIISATESNLRSAVESYIAEKGSQEIKLLFPELYMEQYFKDYGEVR